MNKYWWGVVHKWRHAIFDPLPPIVILFRNKYCLHKTFDTLYPFDCVFIYRQPLMRIENKLNSEKCQFYIHIITYFNEVIF